MPQSQKTAVGRPIKWAQCGCFLPPLGCEPSLRGNDNFQSSAIRSQWLETSHHVRFNEPCCRSMDELLETSSHLKVFIQTKAKTRHVFGSKFNCLEQLLCSLHRSRFGHAMLIACGFCAFSGAFSRSLEAILLVQLAGNHASRGRGTTRKVY